MGRKKSDTNKESAALIGTTEGNQLDNHCKLSFANDES
jgi:hypothetical protein